MNINLAIQAMLDLYDSLNEDRLDSVGYNAYVEAFEAFTELKKIKDRGAIRCKECANGNVSPIPNACSTCCWRTVMQEDKPLNYEPL